MAKNQSTLFSLLGLQFKKMFTRRSFWFSLIVLLAFDIAALIEQYFMFKGWDIGVLPSAAIAWPWNFDNMQVQSMRILAYFLLFALGAFPASDMLWEERKKGTVSCFVSRASRRSYLISNAVISFAEGLSLYLSLWDFYNFVH